MNNEENEQYGDQDPDEKMVQPIDSAKFEQKIKELAQKAHQRTTE